MPASPISGLSFSAKKAVMPLFLMLFLQAWPSARAQSLSTYIAWSYEDAFHMLSHIDGPTLKYGVLGVGLVSAVSLLDSPIKYRSSLGFSRPVSTYAETANLLGEYYVAIPTALGVFSVSMLTKDQKFRDAAFTSAQSLLYATVATGVLKMLAGRKRPITSDSPYQFTPFSGNHSIPSGHATAAFAMLVPWAVYYPGPLTYSLVAFGAAGTAFARIALNKHWLSDVAAGSAIGTITALLLARRHQARRTPVLAASGRATPKLLISPHVAASQRGFSLQYSLH